MFEAATLLVFMCQKSAAIGRTDSNIVPNSKFKSTVRKYKENETNLFKSPPQQLLAVQTYHNFTETRFRWLISRVM